MRNTVVLGGQVVAVEPMRHTPAGIPVIELRLQHRSSQQEANIPVTTEFEFRVWGAGDLARQLSTIVVGQWLTCRGFLSLPSRHSRQWILKANAYQLMDGEVTT